MTKPVDTVKRFGVREASVHMGMFDFTVVFIVCHHSKVCDFIRWKFNDEKFTDDCMLNGGARGRCYARPGYVPVIWIPRYPATPREHGTLAHECFHAVREMFAWSNLPHSSDTEEVMAHAVGHLITKILTELKGR